MEDQEQQEQQQQQRVETVPYARFQQVVSEKGALRSEVDSLKLEIQTLSERGATVDTVTRELEMARTRIASMSADTDLNMGLAERGFDADGRDIIKMLHNKMPEEDRPTALAWVDSMKEDPAKRPRPLLGYFDAPQAMDKVDALDVAPKSKPKMPRSSRHSGGSGTGNADVTAAQIREARESAMKTGQWAAVKTLMDEWDSQRAPG